MDDLVRKLRSQIGDDVREIYSADALFRLAADRIEELERDRARLSALLKEAEGVLTEIRRLGRLVAHDLNGRVEAGKVAAVQRCAEMANKALTRLAAEREAQAQEDKT